MTTTGNKALLRAGHSAACAKRKSAEGSRGFAFSLDLAASVIVMILMLSLMVAGFEAAKEEETARVKKIGLEGKAIFLLDAMAKNRNEEQPLLGSALYDKEKHRVLANEIDVGLLEKARQLELESFFVKSVSLRGGKEKTILFGGEGRQCVSLDRVVLAGKSKALLGVILCEK